MAQRPVVREPVVLTPAVAAATQPAVREARPSFSRALWRIAAADVSSGNRLLLLRDGPSTFDTMLDLIDNARETVDYEGYIYRDDSVGQRFAKAFIEAAQRGVRVRFLIDWVGRWPTPMSFFHQIERAGAAVRVFNPVGFRPWLGLLPRDHRKVLVVDGEAGVTGGIGIGEEWRHGILRQRRAPWRDTAVKIEGEAVGDLQLSFERMWDRAVGKRPRPMRRLVRAPKASHLNTRFHTPSLVGIIEGEPFKERVSRALQLQAVAAERSIWIASAYFAPSRVGIEALAGAARDGVDVRILVPSRWDHFWLRSIMQRSYRTLLRNGVRIWEWCEEMMHAKTSVVDGRWVRIGSTDLNPLGVAINYELDVVVEDPVLGAQAEEMFLEDLERSRELSLGSDGMVWPRELVKRARAKLGS